MNEILATVLAISILACDSAVIRVENISCDANVAESTCSIDVVTWRDALIRWDDIRCTATARCFPEMFVAWYGDHSNCMMQLGAWHCKGGTPIDWCDMKYPRDRCQDLLDCQAESEMIICDEEAVVPTSCEEALR